MIKRLDKKYADGIFELHRKAIYPLWNELKRGYSDEGVRDFILDIFEKGEVYGYFHKNMFVGCIGIEKKENLLEIIFLLVDPVYQGKGIGKELMLFAENKTGRIYEKIILEVLMKNSAVYFYKKMGFNIVEEKNKKYLMEKEL
jgi:ribosomal protein S18 acetylase RimI-like enzyme